MHPSRQAYVNDEKEVSTHTPHNRCTIFTRMPDHEPTTRKRRGTPNRLTDGDFGRIPPLTSAVSVRSLPLSIYIQLPTDQWSSPRHQLPPTCDNYRRRGPACFDSVQ